MSVHESIRESIAAYVLDTIDDGDVRVVERSLLDHLPGCEDCSALMRDLREVAGDLGVAAGVRPVSPAAEARLMDAIEEHPAQGPEHARRRTYSRALAAVAALALIASATANGVLLSRNDRAERRARAVAAAAAIAANPEARTVSLAGPRGTMVLTYLPSGTGVLVAQGLTDPPGSGVYELWLARDARYVPVAIFRPEDGVAIVRFAVAPSEYTVAGVTVEKGFRAQPSAAPLYAGTFRI